MRFRKKVKIMKGLSINLSGSGASLSIGGRGASVTIGKKGTYLNTGIPGTGIYNRQKISGTSSKSQLASQNTSSTQSSTYYHISLNLDEKGSPVLTIKDSNGLIVTDEGIIKRIKREEQYKENVENLINKKKQEIEDNTNSFIDIYKSTPTVAPIEYAEKKLKYLSPQKYHRKKFNITKPSIEGIIKDLESEAKKNISSILFWQNKKKRNQYISDNKEQRYKEELEKWEIIQREFEDAENSTEIEQNNLLYQEYQNKKNELEGYINGNGDYVSSKIESILSEITLTVDFSVDFEFDEFKSTLYIDLDLPEIEDLPNQKVKTLSTGKISIKEKTQKERKQEYAICVCGIAYYFSGLFYNITSKINTIQISGYTQRISKKSGRLEDEYIYSIRFERNVFKDLKIINIDPIEAISNFEHILNITSNFDFKTIVPFSKN
ncbi:DUF4236 domain-containing protein [uncultured Acetobacteroides sp.]|uniref:DUF4236 domain-containing protein n=1 Tax=uncultured Acetobacteroides sp. TaxID=1760811 RepID=UPI0029F586FD|nr:DUF4236 domain-containing protein [uncultured Acetobacteroides sp.]